MAKIDRYIDRYGLKFIEFKKIDLRTLFLQHRAGMDEEYSKLVNSPQLELAKLYYDKGTSWLIKNFKKTKYYTFQKEILHIDPHMPMKKIKLFDSVKKGYLRGAHSRDHILILKYPFVSSRYNVHAGFSPEIFLGHHRAGALLALGRNKADVIVAKDIKCGKRECYGKLHTVYNKII